MAGVIISPRIDYFTTPPVNATNISTDLVVVDPVNPANGVAPIRFSIHSNASFINLSESLLRFKLRILGDGANLLAPTNGHVGFINNIFHSLFQMVKVELNGKRVTTGADLYWAKANIETELSRTREGTFLDALTGDDPDYGNEDAVAANNNPAFGRRANLCNLSRWCEYSGVLAVDFIRNSRNILPNSKIDITLYPNTPAFVIRHDGDAAVAGINFTYEIEDCQFLVRREEISPTATLAIEQRLSRDLAGYYYPLAVCRPLHISQGRFDFRSNDIFNGQLPQKVVIAFVRSTAFQGAFASSPLYFNPTEVLQNIELFVNGSKIGMQRAMEINLAEHSSDLHLAYRQLNRSVNATRSDCGLPFSLAQYRLGHFMYGMDLTPDGNDNLSYRYPTEEGSLSLYVKFRGALPHDLEVLVHATFQESVSINQSRVAISKLSL